MICVLRIFYFDQVEQLIAFGFESFQIFKEVNVNSITFCCELKGLFHPACLARVVSWLAFVVAIFHGP